MRILAYIRSHFAFSCEAIDYSMSSVILVLLVSVSYFLPDLIIVCNPRDQCTIL